MSADRGLVMTEDPDKFVLSDEDWERFEALLDAPRSVPPELKRLLSEPTVFDQDEDE